MGRPQTYEKSNNRSLTGEVRDSQVGSFNNVVDGNRSETCLVQIMTICRMCAIRIDGLEENSRHQSQPSVKRNENFVIGSFLRICGTNISRVR